MTKDPEFPNMKSGALSGVIGLASPKDRLASYVLDCILILPVVQLLQSPIKKAILEAMLFEQAADASYFRYFNLLVFIVFFVAYYAVMIWWKGQTLGKMFFSVKVISYQGRLGFTQALLRSLSIFSEFLLFGYPFLAIFNHPLRRPIHDRVGDTLVISLKNPVGFPGPQEKLQSKVLATVLSFGLLAAIVNYVVFSSFNSEGSKHLSQQKNCENLKSLKKSSMDTWIELHLTRSIDDGCLFTEARHRLWRENEKSLAQFALALSQKEDKTASNQYLESICRDNKDDSMCLFGEWIRSGKKSKEKFSLLVDQVERLPWFAKVSLAIELEQGKQYKKSLEILQTPRNNHKLNEVVASLSFNNLLGLLKWDEAFWVFKTNEDVNSEDFLYFLSREIGESRFSQREKMQLIELFYPQVLESTEGRQPASLKAIPAEIKDIYLLLQGEI